MGHTFESFVGARSLERPELHFYKGGRFSPNYSNELKFDYNCMQSGVDENEVYEDLIKYKNKGPWSVDCIYFIPDMKKSRINKM